MVARPVEWVLVIFYGPSAHRATYGRLDGQDTKYTKDYIQLSKKSEFLETVNRLFPSTSDDGESVPLTYQWPTGTTRGALVLNSADRPHLKWETSLGAPRVWKMSPDPSDASSETIPGDPSHLDFDAAENELSLLAARGAGQPYLLAIKLRGEPETLHLRTYLKKPSKAYAWADLELVPKEIQELAARTSRRTALAWSIFQSNGSAPDFRIKDALSRLGASENVAAVVDALDANVARALIGFLRNPGYGLYFDPERNHDAWLQFAPLPIQIMASIGDFLKLVEERARENPQSDDVEEQFEVDPEEVDAFRDQIEHKSYEVADSTATVKTRGSAQRAFAEAVKANYGYRCAITGLATKDFLVASHIVPWSEDQSIRLDPSNGICLSLLVDRAFEKGYLVIEDDLTIRIEWSRVGTDRSLRHQLEPYDGRKLRAPRREPPRPAFLQRRRVLLTMTD